MLKKIKEIKNKNILKIFRQFCRLISFPPVEGSRAQEPMKTSKKRSFPVCSTSPMTTDLRAAFSSNHGPVLSYSNTPNWAQYSRQDYFPLPML